MNGWRELGARLDRRRHDLAMTAFSWKRKKVVDGWIWPEHQKSPTSTFSKLQPPSQTFLAHHILTTSHPQSTRITKSCDINHRPQSTSS
eukprot:scaffold1771_cov82-Skeletonema_dohrnii-CCMP3373.AAC.4